MPIINNGSKQSPPSKNAGRIKTDAESTQTALSRQHTSLIANAAKKINIKKAEINNNEIMGTIIDYKYSMSICHFD
jgi:hypothetical protein